jgi:dUTP pyrophosphatase
MSAPERVYAVLTKEGAIVSTYIGEARAHEVVTYVRERPAPVLPIKLLNPHAIAPRRAHADDAGLDCHALLGMLQSTNDPDTLTLAPHGAAVIRLGFAVAIPRGHVGLLTGRSGLAVKAYIHGTLGVIDSGYRGEVCAHMTNHGSEPFTVTHGDRITQLIVLPIVLAKVLLVDELPPSLDGRGDSGFGSTGTAPSGPGDEVSQ